MRTSRIASVRGVRRLKIIGIVVFAIAGSFVPGIQCQTETVLYNFTGGSDGYYPVAGLAIDLAGNLYGTTFEGGNTRNCGVGCGTLFEVSPISGGWTESTLHAFLGGYRDGGGPVVGLVADAAGNFYGATSGGGTFGCGAIFKLRPNSNGSWTEGTLYSFTCGADGMIPYGGLIIDSAGNIYGTTHEGGNSDVNCGNSCGVVFKLSRTSNGWKETVLRAFTASKGGYHPSAGLAADAAGNLYGTTTQGGSGCLRFGCGVVFELSRRVDGTWRETVLYSFTGSSDGGNPLAGLIFDASGNLFGTTQYGGVGGCSGGSCGVVFELSPSSSGWKETVLHTFAGGPDGGESVAGVVFDRTGNLYGTTLVGGNMSACQGYGCGVVFELSPTSSGWTETALHAFSAFSGDGSEPRAGLILDLTGNLYGTTSIGGTLGLGTVFEISW